MGICQNGIMSNQIALITLILTFCNRPASNKLEFIEKNTLANKLLYQCGPATINSMHWIFHIEVSMCIFHLINDFIMFRLIC